MASDGSLHFDTTLDSTGFERGSEKMKSAISDLESSVNGLGDAAKAATGSAVEAVGEAATGFENGAETIKEAVSGLEEPFIDLGETAKSSVEEALESASETVRGLRAEMQEMAESQGNIAIADLDPQQYRALQDALQGIAARAREAREALEQSGAQGTNSQNFEQTRQELIQLEAAAEQASNGIRRRFNANRLLQGLQTGFRAIGGAILNVGGYALRAAAFVGRLALSLGRVVGRGIISGVQLLGRGFSAVGSGVKTVGDKLRGFISRTTSATFSTKGLVRELTSLKTMLISRVKGIFIRELTEGISNALKALTQYSSIFDQSVSSMKNAMTELSSNISVAFANLINAVAPAITQIIDWLSTAITYINAFFAMLSGKSVMTVAKKQTGSYAASLNDTAGSASKAADAQKELNEQVYGFDQLNKRSSQNDSKSGSTGGSGSPSAADLFEEVPVDSILPENVKNFFEEIKRAFEEGDWEGIGRIVADGLNEIVLAGDRWINENRPKIVGWSTNIADLLNGLVDRFNGNQLGSTVANGLNTILEALNNFYTRFNSFNLGSTIASIFNGLSDTLNWSLLGSTIAGSLNSIINAFEGFVYTLQWGDIGTNLGTAIQSFADTLDLNSIVHSVKLSIKGIGDAVDNLHNTVDWERKR